MCAARLIFVDDATAPGALDSTPCALVIGNFDGVHRGHQAVIAETVERGSGEGGRMACALTFDPHPGEVVGAGAPPVLTSLEDRVELMGNLGIGRVYVRRFDAAFAAWPPERFARELVAQALRAKVVVVGQNFRFGARRGGDLNALREFGAALDFDVHVPAVASDLRGAYSSTRARDAVAAGDMAEANRVLGRPHAIAGLVVRGDARGRTIGFPTANIDAVLEMLPKDGVYAVVVDRMPSSGEPPTRLGSGVANVGVRPTVGGGKRLVEVHLFDFAGDLYGARLRVHFVSRLRDEKKFSSLDELKAQIVRDAAAARLALSRAA